MRIKSIAVIAALLGLRSLSFGDWHEVYGEDETSNIAAAMCVNSDGSRISVLCNRQTYRPIKRLAPYIYIIGSNGELLKKKEIDYPPAEGKRQLRTPEAIIDGCFSKNDVEILISDQNRAMLFFLDADLQTKDAVVLLRQFDQYIVKSRFLSDRLVMFGSKHDRPYIGEFDLKGRPLSETAFSEGEKSEVVDFISAQGSVGGYLAITKTHAAGTSKEKYFLYSVANGNSESWVKIVELPAAGIKFTGPISKGNISILLNGSSLLTCLDLRAFSIDLQSMKVANVSMFASSETGYGVDTMLTQKGRLVVGTTDKLKAHVFYWNGAKTNAINLDINDAVYQFVEFKKGGDDNALALYNCVDSLKDNRPRRRFIVVSIDAAEKSQDY